MHLPSSMMRPLALGVSLLLGLFILLTQWFVLVPLPFIVFFSFLFRRMQYILTPVVLLIWFACLMVRGWEPNLLVMGALVPVSMLSVWLVQTSY